MTEDSDKMMDEALKGLPQLAPPVSVWREVENRLDALENKGRRRARLGYAGYGLAASALLAAVVLSFAHFRLISEVELADTAQQLVKETTPSAQYTRHLYSAEDALLDAVLEKEIEQVDKTMLYSSPKEQEVLWRYRNKLKEQLEQVRRDREDPDYRF